MNLIQNYYNWYKNQHIPDMCSHIKYFKEKLTFLHFTVSSWKKKKWKYKVKPFYGNPLLSWIAIIQHDKFDIKKN